MDWIRQNTFLATFGGISLLGFLGLGYFAFSSWKASGAAIDEFNDTRDNLDRLENAALHPNEDNLEKVKTEVDSYSDAVDTLFKKLEDAQKPLPTDVDVTKFGEKIQAELAPFQAKAKELNVILGDNFYMGMDKYRTETARNSEVLTKLEWSLGGISHLADIILDSGITDINSFERMIEPWELAQAKPVEKKPVKKSKRPRRSSKSKKNAPAAPPKLADVREETRLRMRLTGSPDAITEFVNRVSNDGEYFYWIRWAKIANQTAVGPSRTQIFNPLPVKGRGREEIEADEEADVPDAAVEEDAAMIDVFPILGSEQVRGDLLIDIVRFREPAAPADEKADKE